MTWPANSSPDKRWTIAAKRVAELRPGDLLPIRWVNRDRTACFIRRHGKDMWFRMFDEESHNRLSELALTRRHFLAMEREYERMQ